MIYLTLRLIFFILTQQLRKKLNGTEAPSKRYATGSVAAAREVGLLFGTRANAMGIERVYWQRPGRYHGKIKAFIDAVREQGIATKRRPPTDMPPLPTITN